MKPLSKKSLCKVLSLALALLMIIPMVMIPVSVSAEEPEDYNWSCDFQNNEAITDVFSNSNNFVLRDVSGNKMVGVPLKVEGDYVANGVDAGGHLDKNPSPKFPAFEYASYSGKTLVLKASFYFDPSAADLKGFCIQSQIGTSASNWNECFFFRIGLDGSLSFQPNMGGNKTNIPLAYGEWFDVRVEVQLPSCSTDIFVKQNGVELCATEGGSFNGGAGTKINDWKIGKLNKANNWTGSTEQKQACWAALQESTAELKIDNLAVYTTNTLNPATANAMDFTGLEGKGYVPTNWHEYEVYTGAGNYQGCLYYSAGSSASAPAGANTTKLGHNLWIAKTLADGYVGAVGGGDKVGSIIKPLSGSSMPYYNVVKESTNEYLRIPFEGWCETTGGNPFIYGGNADARSNLTLNGAITTDFVVEVDYRLKNTGSLNGFNINVELNDNDKPIVSINSKTGSVSGLTTISLNEWHHFKFAFDMTNKKVAVYVDGIKAGILNYADMPASVSKFTICKFAKMGSGVLSKDSTASLDVDNINVYEQSFGEANVPSTYNWTADLSRPASVSLTNYSTASGYLHIPMVGGNGSGNWDKNFCVANPLIEAGSHIVLSVDYRPHYAAGLDNGMIQMQFITVNANGTDKNWFGLFQINLQTGSLEFRENNADIVKTGAPDLTLDAWNNIKLNLDLETGAGEAYVNGLLYATYTLGYPVPLQLNASKLLIGKCNKQAGAYTETDLGEGSNYLDINNLSIKTYDAAMFENLQVIPSDFESNVLYIKNTAGAASSVFPAKKVAGAEIEQVEYIAADFTTKNEASIRLSGYQGKTNAGIRFQSNVADGFWAQLASDTNIASVKVGNIITPTAYIAEAGAFTKAALDKYSADNDGMITYVEVETEDDATTLDNAYSHNGGAYQFTGSLVDIKDSHYTEAFSALGYIKLTFKDGSTRTIFSQVESGMRTNGKTIQGIAQAALEDGEFTATLTPSQLDQLKIFAGDVD